MQRAGYTASGVSGSSFLRLFPVFALSNALFYLCVLAVTGVCLALGDTPGAETAGNAVLYIMGSAYVLHTGARRLLSRFGAHVFVVLPLLCVKFFFSV